MDIFDPIYARIPMAETLLIAKHVQIARKQLNYMQKRLTQLLRQLFKILNKIILLFMLKY